MSRDKATDEAAEVMAARLDAYDFFLPERAIALRPASPRSSARMMVLQGGDPEDRTVLELPDLLSPGDLLVFNDTKVIPARLRGIRRRASAHGTGDAKIEILLVDRLNDADWRVMARPAKRLSVGDVIQFADAAAGAPLTAEVRRAPARGETVLRFDQRGGALDNAFETLGETPLPPYIASKRPADAQDRLDYQTVFAAKCGAVAAPTAALHFDEALLAKVAAAQIETATLTLHVGAGTFLPLTADNLALGRLHEEEAEVSAETAQAVRRTKARGGRVVAVGTTAARALESAALASETTALSQKGWRGRTDLFIQPGFEFKVVDVLMTNFHLPRSSLMMLVSALAGRERVLAAYEHAIREGYRFFSYGDASLLFPENT